MKDHAGVRAARALPGATERAAAAIQLELEIPDDRPRREMTFSEFITEGMRRARALGEAEEALRRDSTPNTRARFSRARSAFDELVAGRMELLDSFARDTA